MFASYLEQVRGLLDDGVDVPIMTQVTIETTGTMLLGTEISAAAVALGNYPIMSMGLNCATGPTQMAEHVQWLGRHWAGMISVAPNAGMPALRARRCTRSRPSRSPTP